MTCRTNISGAYQPTTPAARADAPLAHFLPEERARLSSGVRIEQARAIERGSAERHVDPERNPRAECHGLSAVVEQRDHRPLAAIRFRQPARARRPPDRQHASAHIIAVQAIEGIDGAVEPIRFDPYVVIGRQDHVAGRERDARVQGRAPALCALEGISQRDGKRPCGRFHDASRVIRRVVVYHDHFPRARRLDLRETRQRVAQVGRAVVRGDDDGAGHAAARAALRRASRARFQR
jgi:hypothetical protein